MKSAAPPPGAVDSRRISARGGVTGWARGLEGAGVNGGAGVIAAPVRRSNTSRSVPQLTAV